jgi:hypothetical protein
MQFLCHRNETAKLTYLKHWFLSSTGLVIYIQKLPSAHAQSSVRQGRVFSRHCASPSRPDDDLIDVCLSHPSLRGILVWRMLDNISWLQPWDEAPRRPAGSQGPET